MKEIREIIAQNIISLRKKNNMTQNELAEKLNYSDNTISRWEHAEITPSVESLEQLAKVFEVPIETLLKEDVLEKMEKNKKSQLANKISTILLCICMVWFIAAVCFFYVVTFENKYLWIIFVWALPITFAVLILFAFKMKSKLLIFIFASLFVWAFLAAIYLHFLPYNLYLVFIIGIPAEASLSVWAFVKKRS